MRTAKPTDRANGLAASPAASDVPGPLQDLHVAELSPLISPRALKAQLPASEHVQAVVVQARRDIQRIVRKDDPRLLVVIGPCSIHDTTAALEYAARLNELRAQYQDRLLILMRAYFEKPRTTVGWRGLINDPDMDGGFAMEKGLCAARKLLLTINAMGLPTAVEMLDPVTPQYFADLVSWGTIGARTTESQPHRAMASGLSMPIGFKNGTDGGYLVAIQAILSARGPHSFLGINQQGTCCVVRTQGNPDTMLILRGGSSGPNYQAAAIRAAADGLRAAGLPESMIVDCSHANSNYAPDKQADVWKTVLDERAQTGQAVIGLMVESHLGAGRQNIPPDRSQLQYGVSVTDGCIDWPTTERLLAYAYEQVG
jgi:3-deoxy-7-phosphoheptulonate synthase